MSGLRGGAESGPAQLEEERKAIGVLDKFLTDVSRDRDWNKWEGRIL
jgi:hypothetical protein